MKYTKIAIALGVVFAAGLVVVAIAEAHEVGEGLDAVLFLLVTAIAIVAVIGFGSVFGGRQRSGPLPTSAPDAPSVPPAPEHAAVEPPSPSPEPATEPTEAEQ